MNGPLDEDEFNVQKLGVKPGQRVQDDFSDPHVYRFQADSDLGRRLPGVERTDF